MELKFSSYDFPSSDFCKRSCHWYKIFIRDLPFMAEYRISGRNVMGRTVPFAEHIYKTRPLLLEACEESNLVDGT